MIEYQVRQGPVSTCPDPINVKPSDADIVITHQAHAILVVQGKSCFYINSTGS